MVTILQLLEAVNKIQARGVRIDEMVILAPVGATASWIQQEYETNSGRSWLCNPEMPAKFNGVLIIEDQSFRQDVFNQTCIVKSLVSEHREVVP